MTRYSRNNDTIIYTFYNEIGLTLLKILLASIDPIETK